MLKAGVALECGGSAKSAKCLYEEDKTRGCDLHPSCDGILGSMSRTFKKVDYDQALESFGAVGRLSAI